ncbi:MULTISPECIES: hypothetical protein [unclassified Halomonas]|uniref:hypothetical protein n=1 Tax=unclassified Halomonas TaxID=2609666 RepID=UPI0007D8D8E9|nr:MULTISPECIES: hypothetical protein [unclassified Halomonas]MBT2787293.1 hypothetical protein [Halomonas sp. ISL-106]MBT2796343.1 hypothetical protein [Halomonas sp. ISL-104]OAL57508.1 hypothetical protein A6R74_12095 [Halomonas sp. ALS9]
MSTLNVVKREGDHLTYSWLTLFAEEKLITQTWVETLDDQPQEAVFLEAFVSRFGRMQDTLADKLLPRWLQALAEKPGSQIETLNRAERLGVVNSVEGWLIARKLRNQLVHEYMENAREFAEAINIARDSSLMLLSTYNQLHHYAENKMLLTELPGLLNLPN